MIILFVYYIIHWLVDSISNIQMYYKNVLYLIGDWYMVWSEFHE